MARIHKFLAILLLFAAINPAESFLDSAMDWLKKTGTQLGVVVKKNAGKADKVFVVVRNGIGNSIRNKGELAGSFAESELLSLVGGFLAPFKYGSKYLFSEAENGATVLDGVGKAIVQKFGPEIRRNIASKQFPCFYTMEGINNQWVFVDQSVNVVQKSLEQNIYEQLTVRTVPNPPFIINLPAVPPPLTYPINVNPIPNPPFVINLPTVPPPLTFPINVNPVPNPPFTINLPTVPPPTNFPGQPIPNIPKVEQPIPTFPEVEPPKPNFPRVEPPKPNFPRVEPPTPNFPRAEQPTPNFPRVEPSSNRGNRREEITH